MQPHFLSILSMVLCTAVGAEVFPIGTPAKTKRGDDITLTGQYRMGQTGVEYKVKTTDGKEKWVPRSQFELPKEAGTGRGGVGIQRYYEGPVPSDEFYG